MYLEMLHVNRVKSDQRGVEPDVSLRDLLPVVIRTLFRLREMFLYSVEGFEEGHHGLLVGFLSRGESGAVHPVVYIVVRPFVRFLDLLLQVLREQVDVLVFLREEIIKLFKISVMVPLGCHLGKESNGPQCRTSE